MWGSRAKLAPGGSTGTVLEAWLGHLPLEAKEQVMHLGTGCSLCLEVGVGPRGAL